MAADDALIQAMRERAMDGYAASNESFYNHGPIMCCNLRYFIY